MGGFSTVTWSPRFEKCVDYYVPGGARYTPAVAGVFSGASYPDTGPFTQAEVYSDYAVAWIYKPLIALAGGYGNPLTYMIGDGRNLRFYNGGIYSVPFVIMCMR
jgi:hypothetical protein